MIHHVILFSEAFSFSKAMVIRADSWAREGKSACFYRDEKLIYRAPGEFIMKVERFDDQVAAEEYAKGYREMIAGTGTFSIHEYGTASTRAGRRDIKTTGSGITERFTVHISEQPKR